MSITLAATGKPRSTTKQSTPPQPSLIFTPSPHLKIKKCPHFKRQCTPARVGPRLRGQVCGATALLLHDLSIPLNSSIPVQTCTSPQPLQGALQEPARLSLACSCNTPSLSCPSRRPRPHHCSPQRRRRAWAALPPFACGPDARYFHHYLLSTADPNRDKSTQSRNMHERERWG
jgi:hypothetical protein